MLLERALIPGYGNFLSLRSVGEIVRDLAFEIGSGCERDDLLTDSVPPWIDSVDQFKPTAARYFESS